MIGSNAVESRRSPNSGFLDAARADGAASRNDVTIECRSPLKERSIRCVRTRSRHHPCGGAARCPFRPVPVGSHGTGPARPPRPAPRPPASPRSAEVLEDPARDLPGAPSCRRATSRLQRTTGARRPRRTTLAPGDPGGWSGPTGARRPAHRSCRRATPGGCSRRPRGLQRTERRATSPAHRPRARRPRRLQRTDRRGSRPMPGGPIRKAERASTSSTRGRRTRKRRRPPAPEGTDGRQSKNPAATYSPARFPAEYHRLWRA
jgi:hypothetical protein